MAKRRINQRLFALALEEEEVKTGEGGEQTTETVPTDDQTQGGDDNQVVVDLPEGTSVDEVEIVVSEEDLAVIDSEGEEAAEILDAGEEQVEQADAVIEEVPQVEEAVATLESLAEIVELSASRGGLSLESAAILDSHVKYVMSSIQFPEGRILPAMEAFTQAKSRVGGTTIALENLGERIKEIVTKLIEAIKKAFAWVLDFGKKLIDARYRMESRAKKIAEVAAKIKTQPVKVDVGNPGLAAALAIGNGVSTKIVADLVALNGFARGTVDGKTTNSIGSMATTLTSLSNAAAADREDGAEGGKLVEQVVATVESIIGKGLKSSTLKAADLGIDEAPEGTKLIHSDVFLGNHVFWAYMPQTPTAFDKLRIGVDRKKAEAPKGAKLAALSPTDIVKVAESVLDYTKSVEDYKKTEEVVKKFAATYAKELAKYSSGQNAGEGISEKIKSMLSVARGARAMVKGLHQPAFSVAARVNGAALDYAAASLKAYGKDKRSDAEKGLTGETPARADRTLENNSTKK